ncbi:DEAD/DEAH box helicase [Brucella endophytica]|nr:DEAD/DEAH box helicase [Brucella endophytica]
MNYPQAEIRRLFDTVTWERGAAYAREGRVLSASWGDGSQIVKATVRGSGRNTYGQTIHVAYDSNGAIRAVAGHCSCPIGYNCKHVAAVCYSRASGKAGRAPPSVRMNREAVKNPASAPATLPARLASWLGDLQAAQSQMPDDPDIWPATVRDRLLYLLNVDGNGRLTIETMKSTVLKNGNLSATARRYDVSRIDRQNSPKFIRLRDLKIISRLKMLGFAQPYYYYGQQPEPVPGEIYALLEMIAETGLGRWRDPAGPALHAGETREGVFQWQTLKQGAQQLMLTDKDGRRLHPLPLDPPAFVDPQTGEIGLLTLDAPARMVPLLLNAPVIPAEHASQIMRTLLEMPQVPIPVPQRIDTETRQARAPLPVLRLSLTKATRHGQYSWMREPVQLPTLRLSFDYDGRVFGDGPGGQERFLENGKAVTLLRDRQAEEQAFDRLQEAGALFAADIIETPDRNAGKTALYFSTADELTTELFGSSGFDDAVLEFMTDTLPELRKDGWRIEIAEDWPYKLYDGPMEIRGAAVPRGGDGRSDYFSMGVHLEAGGEELDLVPMIRQLLDELAFLDRDAPDWDDIVEGILAQMTLYPRLKDGRLIPLEAASLLPLLRVFLSAIGLMDGFHKAEAGRAFEIAEALEGCGIPFEAGPELHALGHKLRALAANPQTEPPSMFRATLRPYQKTGFGWLKALGETGFGGILADDMGLGKTVQTLAFLAERHLGDNSSKQPSLLLVPTSLVHTWRRQAEQFVPELKVLILHGPERQKEFGAIAAHHVVVTSYPLLNRDHDVLTATQWDVVVLDEAQTVKNPAASIAKRIRELKSAMRLALTGTPMENSLLDLWALYDWLIPGLLGDRKTFRSRFLVPVETHGDAHAQAELNARLRPFMLRRTKEQVALDLPEKTEITELVELGDRQAALYESIRLAMDERVRKAIAERGVAGSQITILDALLKLRQVCCDPQLLKHDAAKSVTGSAKRSRLLELLATLIAEGRRVLVFSQFVEMLRLIEEDVKAQGWSYAWLTGDTVNRDEVVSGFQSGDAPVFLISLKAGGVGLTLTAADTVILYDPWWNPAVERQAMDRVHRIGQNRNVFVYRLITEGSVEEAISRLQQKKQALADALFEGGEHGPLALEADDIAALFQPLGTAEA